MPSPLECSERVGLTLIHLTLGSLPRRSDLADATTRRGVQFARPVPSLAADISVVLRSWSSSDGIEAATVFARAGDAFCITSFGAIDGDHELIHFADSQLVGDIARAAMGVHPAIEALDAVLASPWNTNTWERRVEEVSASVWKQDPAGLATVALCNCSYAPALLDVADIHVKLMPPLP